MDMKTHTYLLVLITSCLVISAGCGRKSGADADAAPPEEASSAIDLFPSAAPPPPPRPAQVVAATVASVYAPADIAAWSVKNPSVTTIARSPCIGAIAIDADSGRVLVEENADALALPASMTKMMLLLLLQERIEAGSLATNAVVPVSVRAAKTGGSQVYLDPRESFPVEDLMYALMIQSANDAAVALAEFAAGSCEAMVVEMNRRAAELGMRNTRFASVHGLPASAGEPNDATTPRDMAILSAELCQHPDALRYTSEAFRVFRPAKPFEMRTHNPLLQRKTPGCDGLKTGYTKYAGYSIAASVVRNGRRVVVVQMGSPDKQTRDRKLDELLATALAAMSSGGFPTPATP